MLVEHCRQCGKLKVSLVGNEATAVAASACADRECHHVAALEFETAYRIVEFGIRQSVHVAVAVLQSEVVDRRTLEVLFRVDSERFEVLAVREDDGASVIHSHLTVHIVLRLLAVDVDVLHVASQDERRLHIVDYHHCVRIDDVHTSCRGKRCDAGNVEVHSIGDAHSRCHLIGYVRIVLCRLEECHYALQVVV